VQRARGSALFGCSPSAIFLTFRGRLGRGRRRWERETQERQRDERLRRGHLRLSIRRARIHEGHQINVATGNHCVRFVAYQAPNLYQNRSSSSSEPGEPRPRITITRAPTVDQSSLEFLPNTPPCAGGGGIGSFPAFAMKMLAGEARKSAPPEEVLVPAPAEAARRHVFVNFEAQPDFQSRRRQPQQMARVGEGPNYLETPGATAMSSSCLSAPSATSSISRSQSVNLTSLVIPAASTVNGRLPQLAKSPSYVSPPPSSGSKRKKVRGGGMTSSLESLFRTSSMPASVPV